MTYTKPGQWTATECPWPELNGGHTRQECERQRQTTKAGRICRFHEKLRQQKRNRERKKNPSAMVGAIRGSKPLPVILECSHTVLYRMYMPLEPLYCVRCDDWVKPWRP